jgi:osmotically inducible lipoprotein OsmB
MRSEKAYATSRCILLCIVLLSITGCSNMTAQEQRMLSGAGIGAGVGAVGTVMTGGCVSCGAAIGAGAGAVGGYIYDRSRKHD